jgi:hypothetical protein
MRRPSPKIQSLHTPSIACATKSYDLVPRLILILHNEMVKHKPNWYRKELQMKTPPPPPSWAKQIAENTCEAGQRGGWMHIVSTMLRIFQAYVVCAGHHSTAGTQTIVEILHNRMVCKVWNTIRARQVCLARCVKLHSSGCVIYFVLMKISILSRILVYLLKHSCLVSPTTPSGQKHKK